MLKNKECEELFVVTLQLMLGSDYKKEINTLINHFKLEMEYSNRLFTTKRYANGKLKTAIIIDITKEVKDFVLDNDRTKNYN